MKALQVRSTKPTPSTMQLFQKPSLLLGAFLGLVKLSQQQNFSSSYAPVYVHCPTNVEWLRPANGLSPAEESWVAGGRKKVVLDALDGYLERLELADFDYCGYVEKLRASNYANVPTLGFAISGGGYSSAFTGTAALRALDDRLPAANHQKTGGLFQALTYISGLSGGAWPTLSFASHDFPTADQIVQYWQPEIERFNVNTTTQYAATNTDIFGEIVSKLEAGFEISMPDYFGIAWGYEFIAGPTGGLNTTLSNIATLGNFVTHNMPMPIIVADQITPNDVEYYGLPVPYYNTTIFEFSPFESGAWSGPKEFFPTKYMGTTFVDGKPANASLCVEGYDRGSFMLGMAGAAANFWYIESVSNGTLAAFPKRSIEAPLLKPKREHPRALAKREITFPLSGLQPLIDAFQEFFGLNFSQAAYPKFPNPFPSIEGKDLTFADGSEGGQSIPLWPLIQPARKSSFIVAWDSDSDQGPYGWNNGTNLYNSYIQAEADGIPFPIVPPPTTFIHNNYTTKPVFFGCEAALTTTKSTESPIIFYMANSPYTAYTNYSFFQMSTSFSQIDDIFENGFNQLTQGNGTLDTEWPACLGCAVIDRSLGKLGMTRTKQCEGCFEKYCWDGEVYEGEVGVVDIPLVLDPSLSFAEWSETHDF